MWLKHQRCLSLIPEARTEGSPEHQAEVEAFLPHQVASEPVGGGVGQEDDALREAVARAVHVGLLQGGPVRSVQLGLVHVHKVPLLAQARDGTDVVQRLARNLQTHPPLSKEIPTTKKI